MKDTMGAPEEKENWPELSMCWWSVVEQDQVPMCHCVPMRLIRNASALGEFLPYGV